ncbi:MAG TPA: hypothetical protein VKX16_12470 [Chloroflexota bacterium]|nr:hypothetical protein [Chloroflexota bacterium]
MWTAAVTAPSVPGEYHYTVGLFSAGGHRDVIDNDGWNVLVASGGSGQGSGQPQPLPADVPLVPPFNYSNPVAATFQAEGKTVYGSEVSSNRRPDVPPSAVSQFYAVRLPRAGWTLDQTTIPAAGATAFTLVATSGAVRVCVVQFADGAVHIFYGSLAQG